MIPKYKIHQVKTEKSESSGENREHAGKDSQQNGIIKEATEI